MPFNYCNLTLKAADDPYVTIEDLESTQSSASTNGLTKFGVIYDLLAIVPHIGSFGKNPISGKTLK